MVKAIKGGDFACEATPGGNLNAFEAAPRSDWNGMTETDHFVQFYETDAFLLNSLSKYIGTGLGAGDGCIVVANKAHRDSLERSLNAKGLDMAAASARGQYVSLDPAETLSKFTVDGEPEPRRFAEVIGSAIKRTREGRARVRVFGDMVALLCGQGNHDAAIRLEQMWNDLRRAHSFSLFCAYPMHGFADESLTSHLSDICSLHTRIIPAENYSELTDDDARLRTITLLQHKARMLEREVAERKQAEEQLRRKEHELRDFIENAPLGLHWVGPDGTILWANQAELDMLGYSKEEYIGRPIGEFHADRQMIDDILRRLMNKETLHSYEAQLRCKDGSIRHVLISSNVLWENGKFRHTRCFTRDITERRRAELERECLLVQEQMARAEAEAANRLKDEFLATVSHELRTPLTAIMGWSHMLQDGRLDEATITHGLETIERNARAQAQLVEDILDVSRVITGKLRLNIGPVDVAAVINAAIDSVQLAADSKEIQLEVTLDPSARHVSGDANRLQQIVWNLLSNAIKFTPAGGSVRVLLERAGSQVQLRVSDTGDGISPDFLPYIFDRFRQADGTITRQHGGLGLGLAIVRHLVELHGGTVHADSDGVGRGATFTINLPLAPSQKRGMSLTESAESLRSNEEAEAQAQPLPSIAGVRVLLVDDDQDTINMLAFALTEFKAVVQTATSAAEALEVLEWYKPDVLVSDLAMPGEDGYSLIHKVRGLEASGVNQIPAVALTAYVRVEDRMRALSAGFNMFVPKPVEPNELITVIANLTEPVTTNMLLSRSEM
ncbi:MAG TPA: ATP-binding protein [Pyrinomonadaceae bacterium]